MQAWQTAPIADRVRDGANKASLRRWSRPRSFSRLTGVPMFLDDGSGGHRGPLPAATHDHLRELDLLEDRQTDRRAADPWSRSSPVRCESRPQGYRSAVRRALM